jgi:hypothetical protein
MTTLEDINTYNLECQKLLFYCNSLIASVLNQRTINKNAQQQKIGQIKNEFNRRVSFLQNNFKINMGGDADANAASLDNTASSIPIVCSLIPNNIMLSITMKKSKK